ncbi:MAG: hypothetical protein AUH85_17225 [Chloroflexi bacterium 13_1_40CM_4_68_4]|nr:MAG: hypothetical protein AUH85_17225 [Chloroflexi bacterium 13_1_40CM_4_68_4]
MGWSASSAAGDAYRCGPLTLRLLAAALSRLLLASALSGLAHAACGTRHSLPAASATTALSRPLLSGHTAWHALAAFSAALSALARLLLLFVMSQKSAPPCISPAREILGVTARCGNSPG